MRNMKKFNKIWMRSWWDTKTNEKIEGRMIYSWDEYDDMRAKLYYQVWWVSIPRRKDGQADMRYRVNYDKRIDTEIR
jgi:hypothetical protein